MAQHNNIGVFQLPNGNWAYRFTQTVNGKRHNHKSVKDENGEPMKSQKAAIRARQLAIMAAEARKTEPTRRRITFGEVYQEYCEKGRSGKAYTTIRKQDSLWKNHLSAKFGARFIDTISVAEVNDYLAELYYTEGRAYRYVEGFLKMFYLIFGQAYSRNYLRFLYKGIIIKHNKTEPTYTKTSLFLCEKRRFFMARTEKGVVATI